MVFTNTAPIINRPVSPRLRLDAAGFDRDAAPKLGSDPVAETRRAEHEAAIRDCPDVVHDSRILELREL